MADETVQINDLHREVVETRNQVIRNANVVGNLVAEIREIGRQQQQQRRGVLMHSIGAYVFLVLLLGGAFYFLYTSRVDRVEYEKATLRRLHAAAQSEMEQLRQRESARRKTQAEAMAFYRLMQEKKVEAAIERYPEVAGLPLSQVEAVVFQTWVERNRSQRAYASYAAGMRATQNEGWKKAVQHFKRSLKMVARPPHSASLHYYMGIALMKLGAYRDAASALEGALEAKAESLVSSQIRYHLGSVHELLGHRDKARAYYAGYLKRFPNGSHRRLARRQLRGLTR